MLPKFNNPLLLSTALTHKSAGRPNNEKLEILGDSVLGLAVIETLMARFPDADEGQLSKMRDELVSTSHLSECAKQEQLDRRMVVANGVSITNSMLADCLEAVIGALYKDTSGHEFAYAFISRLVVGIYDGVLTDYKTAMYEYLSQRGLPEPIWDTYSKGPAHQARWTTELNLFRTGDSHGLFIGHGRSKREAEQAAAKLYMVGK